MNLCENKIPIIHSSSTPGQAERLHISAANETTAKTDKLMSNEVKTGLETSVASLLTGEEGSQSVGTKIMERTQYEGKLRLFPKVCRMRCSRPWDVREMLLLAEGLTIPPALSKSLCAPSEIHAYLLHLCQQIRNLPSQHYLLSYWSAFSTTFSMLPTSETQVMMTHVISGSIQITDFPLPFFECPGT